MTIFPEQTQFHLRWLEKQRTESQELLSNKVITLTSSGTFQRKESEMEGRRKAAEEIILVVALLIDPNRLFRAAQNIYI